MAKRVAIVVVMAFAVYSGLPFELHATTFPNDQPPLGILIAPAGGPNSTPERERHKPIRGQRPLGILLGPGTAFPVKTAAPAQSVTQPTTLIPALARPIIHTPAPQQSGDRPLGVLIGPTSTFSLSSGPPDYSSSLFSTPTSAQPFVPASTTSIYPASVNSTPERPLGTLFRSKTSSPTSSHVPTPKQATEIRPALPPKSSTSNLIAKSKPPVHFLADEMSFDRERGFVTARGNVEVRYGPRTLFANQISYDQNKDTASATGNVLLREPSGEKIFGDRMEVSGDLKDAIIVNIGIILKDHSRIVGTGARRSAGKVTELRKAIYSPCSLCPDDPSAPPFWQIKAVKIIHDKGQKTIEYRDAWLEFFGFPVAYTPYFRHSDPTVKRKTGFLFPRFGTSSDFGTVLETPFFWALSDHEDLTIRPIMMTSEFPVLALQHRRKMRAGEIESETSITDNSSGEFSTEEGKYGIRAHVKAKARFDLNRTWRWGIDLQRAADDTYMRRYGFGSPSSLDSQLFIEGFTNQNYFTAKTLIFQGLQEDDEQDKSPVIFPLVDFNHVGKRDRVGGRFIFDGNFLALTRAEGTDTRRLALHPRWERPFRGPFGDFYRFETGLNADLYHVNSLSRGSAKTDFDGFSHRLFPYTSLEWRLPLVKSESSIRQTVEPIASLAMAPNGGNSDKFPNEDSTDFEFDETNLFSFNRFSGIDRVEGGPRINYGLKWGIFGEQGGSSTVFIGQTYRFRTDSTFGPGSGLEDNLSDIVSSISISPGSHLNALYRTRFSSDNFSPNRNELTFSAGVPAARIAGSYVFLDRQADSEFSGREELSVSANTIIDKSWRASLNAVRDIASSEMRSIGLNAIYEDECVVLTSQVSRAFFRDRDIKPTDAITFHLILKTIGEVKSTTNLSSN